MNRTSDLKDPDSRKTDRIRLRGIRAEAVIGVYGFERDAPRPLSIDIDLHFDARPAAASDDVADTVDYAEVVALLRECCAAQAPQLLERLAEDMARAVLARFAVSAVWLALHKPGAVDGVDDIIVEITRMQELRS